jgi:hypothetical protein
MAPKAGGKIAQNGVALVSGDGVISIRLPRSLLGAFRSTADAHGLTIHSAARGMITALPPLDDLRSLREPPHEIDTPCVSLYVGWRAVDLLSRTIQDSPFTNSTIFRRLLHALVVTKEIAFVQHEEEWKLQIVHRASE